MKKLNLIVATGVMAYASAGLAAEQKSPWVSTAELGYVNVSGNTETETVKAAIDAVYSVDQWAHKFHADALSSTSEVTEGAVTTNKRSAAKWLASAQSDYKINESDYFYGLLSHEEDRFSGFQFQSKLSLGYGRRVIHTDAHELKLEIGPGYRIFKLEDGPGVDVSRQSDSFIRANAGYIWKISETATFTEDLTAEFGNDQDELKSVTALTANVSGALAMKLSYTIKHLDVVPVGTDKTDKEFAVTLVYKF